MRSEHAISIYGHRNRPCLVISLLEIEHNELTPVNPLKIRFTVYKNYIKMALHTDFSDMKKTFVSHPIFLIISD